MFCNFKQFIYQLFHFFFVRFISVERCCLVRIYGIFETTRPQRLVFPLTVKVPIIGILFHLLIFFFIFSPFCIESVSAFSFENMNKVEHGRKMFGELLMNDEMTAFFSVRQEIDSTIKRLAEFHKVFKVEFLPVNLNMEPVCEYADECDEDRGKVANTEGSVHVGEKDCGGINNVHLALFILVLLLVVSFS